MSPRVSFVIPVLDEQARVAPLLRHLRAAFPASELIVVDGGSADGTVVAALPLCDQLLLSETGRARQMNLGGRSASGEYLLFLHADTRPGFSDAQLAAYLAGRPRWGFCRVRLSGRGAALRTIEFFMNLRSAATRIATGDQMLFMRRDLFQQSGGFDDIPLMEDVALCRRLRRVAPPLVVREPALTSSRRWEERGVARTVLAMWGLRLAYFLGARPECLWRHYYGR
jgi:rSAM/selenodomain-associated transferase 2